MLMCNADGPRNAASRPVDHIALHTMTELDVECIHHATTLSILTALCYTDRQLPAFSTHVHSEAQMIHWFDLLSICFTTNSQQMHNKSNQWS